MISDILIILIAAMAVAVVVLSFIEAITYPDDFC